MVKRLSRVVEIGDAFEPEFDARHEEVRTEILDLLRFRAAGVEWRVAFAFDPTRTAILLVAGDISGVNERRFYRELIQKPDDRFDTHLARLKRGKTSSCLSTWMKRSEHCAPLSARRSRPGRRS